MYLCDKFENGFIIVTMASERCEMLESVSMAEFEQLEHVCFS